MNKKITLLLFVSFVVVMFLIAGGWWYLVYYKKLQPINQNQDSMIKQSLRELSQHSTSTYDYANKSLTQSTIVNEIWKLVYTDPVGAKTLFLQQKGNIALLANTSSDKDYVANMEATILINQSNEEDRKNGLIILAKLFANQGFDPIVRARIGTQISAFMAGLNDRELRQLVFENANLHIKVSENEFRDMAMFDEEVYKIYPTARAAYRYANIKAYYLYTDLQKNALLPDKDSRVEVIQKAISKGDIDLQRMLNVSETDNGLVPYALIQKGLALAMLQKIDNRQSHLDYKSVFQQSNNFIDRTYALTTIQKSNIYALNQIMYALALAANDQDRDADTIISPLILNNNLYKDVFIVAKNILKNHPTTSFYRQALLKLIKIKPELRQIIENI